MKAVVVKRSSAGLGLFANTEFKKGDRIIQYRGEVISDAEAQQRGGRYLFELNDQWTIDGTSRKNTARYINHSCRPNCEPLLNDEETEVHIYAKKTIRPGDELTYNYGSYYMKEIIRPVGCKCAWCSTH